MSRVCPWCISGRIHAETGSSLSYRCTDCGGQGVIEDEPAAESADEKLEREIREMDEDHKVTD